MISKKKQKGVTLISLVITIIILIILASISIKVLLGEDGLITKAKEAKKAQKISEIKERISLEISSAKAEAILRNEELEKAQVKDIIEPKYGTLKEDGDTIVTKEGNYEISLEEIYYGSLGESGSYSAKVEQVEILEQKLKELQEQYNTLKELNSGNTEELEKLNNQITELESTKQRLEGELEAKKQELEQKQTEFANEKKNLENQLKTAQTDFANKEKELQQKIEELENGKKLLAEAITKKGITTSEDATFDTMAENISNITAKGSITAPNFVDNRGNITLQPGGTYLSGGTSSSSNILNCIHTGSGLEKKVLVEFDVSVHVAIIQVRNTSNVAQSFTVTGHSGGWGLVMNNAPLYN